MDPNATLNDLLEVLCNGSSVIDRGLAHELVDALCDWKVRGGFPPTDPRDEAEHAKHVPEGWTMKAS